MELRYHGKYGIFILAISGFLMIISSYLIYYFDPLTTMAKKMSTVTEGSIAFRLWQKPPHEIVFKIFMMNITNAKEFQAGDDDKLKFEEVGPFVYQELLVNTNPQFNPNGTLSYMPVRHLKFIPRISYAHPRDVVVHVPNVPLLGISSMLHQSSYMMNWAVTSIINMFDAQPILNLTVEDYLWGYNDSLVKAASTVLPNWIDFESFGLLDRMLNEGNNTVTMVIDPDRKSGSPLIPEQERGRMYSVESWNGIHGLPQWGYMEPEPNTTEPSNSECNVLEGAFDGTLFPPNISENTVFRLYRKFFCRSIPVKYNHSGLTEHGFDGYWFDVVEDFLEVAEKRQDNECYCLDKKFCLPKGFGDMTPCTYGFPTALSQPHFLNADPVYLDKVEGLKPDRKLHGTSIIINPQMGVLMGGEVRMQINLVMHKTLQSRTRKFDNMILPLFWCEMTTLGVPANIHFLMSVALHVIPVLNVVLIYLLAILGVIFITTSGILVFLSTGKVVQKSPNTMNMGYTAVRMIPLTRKESACLLDAKQQKECVT